MKLIVRFTHSGTGDVFETTASDVVLDFDCVESPTDNRTLAAIDQNSATGGQRFLPTELRGESARWFDMLTVLPE